MSLFYRLAADAMMVIHFTYVGFVIFGLLLTWVGYFLKWQWVRSPWFRWLHLAAILIVVFEAAMGITCPLTVWEKQLREAAGTANYNGSFVANWVHETLFIDAPQYIFTFCYALFGALVVATFWKIPPRRRSRVSLPEEGAK